RRRRPGPVVRPDPRQPEARRRHARQLRLRRGALPAEAGDRPPHHRQDGAARRERRGASLTAATLRHARFAVASPWTDAVQGLGRDRQVPQRRGLAGPRHARKATGCPEARHDGPARGPAASSGPPLETLAYLELSANPTAGGRLAEALLLSGHACSYNVAFRGNPPPS